jgi:hypothetical protein
LLFTGISVLTARMSIVIHPTPAERTRLSSRITFQLGRPSTRFALTWNHHPLPNGVFDPYTSIPTNIPFFDRSGPT